MNHPVYFLQRCLLFDVAEDEDEDTELEADEGEN